MALASSAEARNVEKLCGQVASLSAAVAGLRATNVRVFDRVADPVLLSQDAKSLRVRAVRPVPKSIPEPLPQPTCDDIAQPKASQQRPRSVSRGPSQARRVKKPPPPFGAAASTGRDQDSSRSPSATARSHASHRAPGHPIAKSAKPPRSLAEAAGSKTLSLSAVGGFVDVELNALADAYEEVKAHRDSLAQQLDYSQYERQQLQIRLKNCTRECEILQRHSDEVDCARHGDRSQFVFRRDSTLRTAEDQVYEVQQRLNGWRSRCLRESERVSHLQSLLAIARREGQAMALYVRALETRLEGVRDGVPRLEIDKSTALAAALEEAAGAAERIQFLERDRVADIATIVRLESGGQRGEDAPIARAVNIDPPARPIPTWADKHMPRRQAAARLLALEADGPAAPQRGVATGSSGEGERWPGDDAQEARRQSAPAEPGRATDEPAVPQRGAAPVLFGSDDRRQDDDRPQLRGWSGAEPLQEARGAWSFEEPGTAPGRDETYQAVVVGERRCGGADPAGHHRTGPAMAPSPAPAEHASAGDRKVGDTNPGEPESHFRDRDPGTDGAECGATLLGSQDNGGEVGRTRPGAAENHPKDRHLRTDGAERGAMRIGSRDHDGSLIDSMLCSSANSSSEWCSQESSVSPSLSPRDVVGPASACRGYVGLHHRRRALARRVASFVDV
mmetsp:Transcript_56829/g.130743  ORF Transcript_56829/g.130743 Transcript_56829/m.130743 type:complete len:677 (+) Transcript_56829:24-2054(+)|eukprot:CAMPEP_0204348294 /NCGR_PEP_ID=MMETSP0469-20131031/28608_1 /ASSEMBLY_ACC=CAM_ASM_000384 /TAXON_ID=2969 /ORGANISM="Oxyrrhis marina" /LENGTH=676 /DNA_ID=CAMNT_0051334233 /DNA_START=11 /DNA_END=2041 /DNA_ORIENTATION=+